MKPEERKALLAREKYPRKQSIPMLAAGDEAEILRELRYSAGWGTSPENIESMSEKDFRATRAIILAGQLIGPLLEWAINHITGQAILGHKPAVRDEIRTPHPVLTKETETAQADRHLHASSHINEWKGSLYQGGKPDVDGSARM